jgi:CRP-like cAMP-binding protein
LGIFSECTTDVLDNLSISKITNKYKKGQTLFIQGNHPFGLYCIQSGNIKVTKTGNDGKESIVRIVTGGDVLGQRSLFTDDNYSATATAVEESIVCFFDKKSILKSIEKNPEIALKLIHKLSRDMGNAENKMASFHQKNVRERLAELLLSLKASHGVKGDDGKWQINLKLTREEMATMIGTANETLIRFISEFKDLGLIEQQGKIIHIIDEEELMNFANVDY